MASRGKRRLRRPSAPIERPWFVIIGSAVFLLCIVVLAAGVDWQWDATIGAGVKRAPLWVLLASIPLWVAGVVVGIRQLVLNRRSAGQP